MPNLDEVLRETIRSVVEMGKAELQQAARDRTSCETTWFHRALYEQLKSIPQIDVRWEDDHVDLTLVSGPNHSMLVELKTFPTNYGRSGKPITQFISGVIADLHKLRAKMKPGVVARVVWIAYPVPADLPDHWMNHVDRIKRESSNTEKFASIAVGSDMKALVYISQP